MTWADEDSGNGKGVIGTKQETRMMTVREIREWLGHMDRKDGGNRVPQLERWLVLGPAYITFECEEVPGTFLTIILQHPSYFMDVEDLGLDLDAEDPEYVVGGGELLDGEAS